MPTFDVSVAEKLLTKLINIDKISPAVISLYCQKNNKLRQAHRSHFNTVTPLQECPVVI